MTGRDFNMWPSFSGAWLGLAIGGPLLIAAVLGAGCVIAFEKWTAPPKKPTATGPLSIVMHVDGTMTWTDYDFMKSGATAVLHFNTTTNGTFTINRPVFPGLKPADTPPQ